MMSYKTQKSSEPYQELEEVRPSELNQTQKQSSIPPSLRNDSLNESGVDRSLELTSVSVIPDGMLMTKILFKNNTKTVSKSVFVHSSLIMLLSVL